MAKPLGQFIGIRAFALSGRAGLASLFLLGGLNKVLTFTETEARMAEAGLQPAALLLPATIALELIGSACVIYGRRPAVFAAAALAAFTLATNLWFHRFWELSGEIAALELSLFFKNVAIAGALIFVSAAEAGRMNDPNSRT